MNIVPNILQRIWIRKYSCQFFDVLLTVHLSILISVINQLDAQKFCFTISSFRASACFEHMCSKHAEARNKLIVKQKFCALSWLITEINSCQYCHILNTHTHTHTQILQQAGWHITHFCAHANFFDRKNNIKDSNFSLIS